MADGFSSKTAFVLASIGAAVGLGNIWRFPYIASEHGGIWFLIPYLVCLLVIGIPLFLLEAGQGFLNKKGYFKSIEASKNLKFIRAPLRKAIGTFPVLVSTVILGYYSALCAWSVWFAVEFILGNNPTFGLMQASYTPVLAFIIVFAAACYVSFRGISKGIEPVTGYLVPLLFIFLLLLFAYALLLPGSIGQLEKLFAGNSEKLIDPRTWYYALSQVLFSLSVGYGIMYTYGMHLKSGKGIFSSGFQVAGADTAASLLAFFTVVMVSAAAGPAANGLALSFETLPAFFASQGLLGAIIGASFFILLFSAAFTSIISMLEHTMVSTSFVGAMGKVAISAGIFIIGMLSVLSYSPAELQLFGKPVLDLLDFVFGTFLAPFSALVVAFGCAYLLPHHKIAKAIGLPAKYWGLFSLAAGKVVPAALILLIIFSQLSGLY
jgi:NSS family neurotransmitter:Na+ symporter